jgi:CBS domain-containing protein
MAVIKLKRRIKAHPDVAWKVISDMTGLALAAPHISKIEILEGEGVGLKRRLHDTHGRWWIEECIDWQEGKSYTMRVGESNFAFSFKQMMFRWGMQYAGGDHVLLFMRFSYTPRYGPVGQILDRFKFRPRFEAQAHEIMDGWVRSIHSREWVHNVTVDALLENKGREVISIGPDLPILEVAERLSSERIGCLLVLAEDGGIAGLVSERDIVRALSEHGPQVLDQPVSGIMTTKVIVCDAQDNMMLVMSCMTERRIRHLPVMQEDRLVGMISIGDVVKNRMAELESESQALRELIAARRWREAYRQMGPAAAADIV